MRVIKIIIILLFPLNILFCQNKVLSYVKAESNPFELESTPIKLGFIPESIQDSLLIENLYLVLKNQPKILDKFELFPYNQLLQVKESFRIKNLSSNDIVCLNRLNDLLGIKHIISLQSSIDGLILTIRNTGTGSQEFSSSFMDTDSSTAFKDILKYLMDGVKSVYLDQGVLDISFNPSNANLLVNQKKYLNGSKILLDPGNYFIKIYLEGYETKNDQVQIEAGKTAYKSYVLEKAFGKIEIKVFPDNTTYRINSEKDSTIIFEGVGDITINKVQEGIYIFEFKSLGYTAQKRLFKIKSNDIYKDTINLTRSFWPIEKISTNEPSEASNLKIIPNEYDYEIHYNLLGDPGDTYDIMLYILDKNKPNQKFTLNKLRGDIGDDIQVGLGKKIYWNVLDNMIDPHNNDMSKFSFYLEID